MTLAAFIDLILTPIAGGVGAAIGLSIAARRQPEKFGQFSGWSTKLGVGIATALALFALKML